MNTHDIIQRQTYQQPKEDCAENVDIDGLPYVRIESRHVAEWRVIDPVDRALYEPAGWIVCDIAAGDTATCPLLTVRRATKVARNEDHGYPNSIGA